MWRILTYVRVSTPLTMLFPIEDVAAASVERCQLHAPVTHHCALISVLECVAEVTHWTSNESLNPLICILCQILLQNTKANHPK